MTDFTVTLYKLFLGEQDSITGHYQRGYTVHPIEMAIYPRGTAINVGNGYYTRYSQTGFTEYEVDEGDVGWDQLGKYYMIQSLKPWPNGNELAFYECELEELPYFSLPTSSTSFFGFEDLEHGSVGFMFEDGFERGIFVEVTY